MFGIKPPGVRDKWDNIDVVTQARVLAYSQIRDYEDINFQYELLKARAGI